MSRISFDILGRIAFEEFDIHVETIRPGRTVELAQATVVIAGRPTVTARAWFLNTDDTDSVAGGEPDRLPEPETLPSWPLTSVWPGGYVASLDTRTGPDHHRPARHPRTHRIRPADPHHPPPTATPAIATSEPQRQRLDQSRNGVGYATDRWRFRPLLSQQACSYHMLADEGRPSTPAKGDTRWHWDVVGY
ncbi:acyl-CoA thioesterase domain-containing protein [Nocardia sp. NPDC050710]|uniref:acyl-CoA thioesterase domain-containing protein n=1 Tax=Nocardia sp. NPDC050710 TaxID=3157220 RepID=UPI0033F11B26